MFEQWSTRRKRLHRLYLLKLIVKFVISLSFGHFQAAGKTPPGFSLSKTAVCACKWQSNVRSKCTLVCCDKFGVHPAFWDYPKWFQPVSNSNHLREYVSEQRQTFLHESPPFVWNFHSSIERLPCQSNNCQTGTNKHHSGAKTVIANSNRMSIVTSFVYISLPSTISHKQFTTSRNALDPHEQRQTSPSAAAAAAAPTFFSRWWRNFSISRQQTYCLFKLSRICFLLHERESTHPRQQRPNFPNMGLSISDELRPCSFPWPRTFCHNLKNTASRKIHCHTNRPHIFILILWLLLLHFSLIPLFFIIITQLLLVFITPPPPPPRS